MKELQHVVATKMATMIEDGTIEEMISKNIEKTISEVMDDVFRRYSDIGELIKEKVSESIGTSLRSVALPEYNKFVADTVLTCYGEVLEEQSKEQFKKLLSEFLEPAPKNITAQNLLDEIGKHWVEEARENEGLIELDWEREGSRIEIEIKHPDLDFKSINITLYNHHEDSEDHYHIGYLNGDMDRVLSGPVSRATYATSGVEGFLYRLYCARTTITDFDDVIDENIYVGECY